MTAPRVPTVDDLRVKLCYICREEEHNEAGTTRAWTHPCKCTLIAHESCLLEWIRSAQGNTSRAENALKCPQCGTKYEMQSEKSRVLLFLSFGDRVLQRVGGFFTLAGTAAVVGVMGAGIYIGLTAYGAWAIKNFLGKEVFNLMLTDDPSNWPWTAYLNLPLIPLSLVSSRMSLSNKSAISVVVPIVSIWPGPHATSQWMHHESRHTRDRPYSHSFLTWPPSPAIFGLLVAPIVRAAYKELLHRFAFWLLGARLSDFGKTSRFALQLNQAPFMIRIRANLQDENGNVLQQVNNEDGRRRAGAGGDGEVGGEGADNANLAPNGGANADEVPQDPDAANLAAAERIVDINASSLGRRVGGALLIPYISHLMGSFLFRVSKRSRVVREILGIKQHHRYISGLQLPSLYASSGGDLEGGSGLGRVRYWWRWLAKVVQGVWWGGARRWAELDPVWWRNAVGLGLFVVAKDCLYLLHLWHTKREIETRKVRSRNFAGVDVKELDLKPEFVRGATAASASSSSSGPGRLLVERALGQRSRYEWAVGS